MSGKIWIVRSMLLALAFGNLAAVPATAAAQNNASLAEREDLIKPLVVLIKTQFPDDEQGQFGAGIIFGNANQRIYIATANHLVRRGSADAKNIRVQFKWLPGEVFEAKLLADASPELDLAVLAVTGVSIPTSVLRFDQLGDPGALKRGDSVYLIGNPRGHGWRIYVQPDRMSEPAGANMFLKFESGNLSPGHSGGALLNERLEVVGMNRSKDAPDGEATNIRNVLTTLERWGYPVHLKEVNSATAVTKFHFYYRFGDHPGEHYWTKEDSNTWTERYPTGEVGKMRIIGRITVGGDKGTLLENTKNPQYEYFIPDKGGRLMWLRIRIKDEAWGFLGEMKDVQ